MRVINRQIFCRIRQAITSHTQSFIHRIEIGSYIKETLAKIIRLKSNKKLSCRIDTKLATRQLFSAR